MEEDYLHFPTSVLKVDLHCCAKCPFKVKEALQEINGVYSIEIDAKNGLVQVSGLADPSVLQKAIRKIGKRAEILVNEKDSYQAKRKLDKLRNHKNRQSTKDCRSKDRDCCTKEQNTTSSSSDPDGHNGSFLHAESKPHENKAVKDSVPDERIATMPHPVYGMANNIEDYGFGWHPQGGFGAAYYGGYRGMPPPGYAMPHYAARPYGYAGYRSAIYGSMPPPPPPPHSLPPPPPLPQQRLPLSNLYAVYSGQKDPPVGNSLYHSFSDENVKACTIV